MTRAERIARITMVLDTIGEDAECVGCRVATLTRDGTEPTNICDSCAQGMVADDLPWLMAEVERIEGDLRFMISCSVDLNAQVAGLEAVVSEYKARVVGLVAEAEHLAESVHVLDKAHQLAIDGLVARAERLRAMSPERVHAAIAALDDGHAMSAGPFSIGSTTWSGLSKLIEEAGEVVQVAGKLIATGGETAHWDGTDLRVRLEEEMADVIAACCFVTALNGLDEGAIQERVDAKLATFMKWHEAQS